MCPHLKLQCADCHAEYYLKDEARHALSAGHKAYVEARAQVAKLTAQLNESLAKAAAVLLVPQVPSLLLLLALLPACYCALLLLCSLTKAVCLCVTQIRNIPFPRTVYAQSIQFEFDGMRQWACVHDTQDRSRHCRDFKAHGHQWSLRMDMLKGSDKLGFLLHHEAGPLPCTFWHSMWLYVAHEDDGGFEHFRGVQIWQGRSEWTLHDCQGVHGAYTLEQLVRAGVYNAHSDSIMLKYRLEAPSASERPDNYYEVLGDNEKDEGNEEEDGQEDTERKEEVSAVRALRL